MFVLRCVCDLYCALVLCFRIVLALCIVFLLICCVGCSFCVFSNCVLTLYASIACLFLCFSRVC